MKSSGWATAQEERVAQILTQNYSRPVLLVVLACDWPVSAQVTTTGDCSHMGRLGGGVNELSTALFPATAQDMEQSCR